MKRRIVTLMLLVALSCVAVLGVAGCGNVYLSGDGLTAAQQSTMDAYQAVQRADADPATPATLRVYLSENFKQWRFFVRSAVKDLNWGPKLPGESTTQPAVP
jgi:predicted aminopeptidase